MKCGMLYKRVYLWLFCLSACFFARATAQEYKETIGGLSQTIKEQLSDLKTQRQSLEFYIAELQGELTLSTDKVQALETQLSDLNTTSASMTELLASYSQRLTEYELELKTRAKVIAWLIVLIVIRTLAMVAGYVIYFKFPYIKLPRWVDILL